ncbi:MAG TPA: 3-oxoacyl-ACP reductase family protein [Negativicutes bacterium]|nr:3-oxoacyl-ACP reductase family protein [Negativicutes bacterium]
MLKDKVAIVTGAGRGIGKAIAVALAEHGADIVVNDVNPDNARLVAEEIVAKGRRAIAVTADVTDEARVQAMVADGISRLGAIDILVNNAGIVLAGPLTGIAVADWDKVMAVNLKGVFICCKAVFPHMMARRVGRIINIASVAGKRGGGLLGNSCYAASKGGVIAFTKGIAREGGPYNITANAITPALTDTDMTGGLTAEQRESIIKMMPLGRAGRPEDIAAAVCFLASDCAAFVTGVALNVDGGLVMD